MQRKDLQFELAFYRRNLDYVGILYFRPLELAARFPDVLFFCMYTCHLLMNKKLSLSGAKAIREHLDYSPEEWLQILNWEERRPYTPPCKVTAYKGYARSAMTSSLSFKEKPIFRFGNMGFGFFSNKKHFDRCASGSVFGLLETIYKINSGMPEDEIHVGRRVSKPDQARILSLLWKAASAVARLELGKELYRGNWQAVATALYKGITGDEYPLDTGDGNPAITEGARRVLQSLEEGGRGDSGKESGEPPVDSRLEPPGEPV